MYQNLEKLLKDAEVHIFNKDEKSQHFYNLPTHQYITKEGWELLFPLEKQNWPERFSNMERNYDPELMTWPGFTTYCYTMDVAAPPSIPSVLLHFGYAIVDGKLVRSTFFVVQQMVGYQGWPQGMVIDPLAEIHGIQPAFYVGCNVPMEEIEHWMFNRRNPLETYVDRKNKELHQERLHDIYMESYRQQMLHEPEWFPVGLIEFAKKENLYIPPQKKNLEEDDIDDDWAEREAHAIQGGSLHKRS